MTFHEKDFSPEHLAHSLTINYASLNQQELAKLSLFIGGSYAKVAHYSPELTISPEVGGAIIRWGDERLDDLLEDATKAAGYSFGAENIQIVALTASDAIWFLVVPKFPLDREAVQDDNGEVIDELLSLAIPEADANNVFYTWDEEGLRDMEDSLQRGLLHRPWVDRDGYYLAFELSTKYRNFEEITNDK